MTSFSLEEPTSPADRRTTEDSDRRQTPHRPASWKLLVVGWCAALAFGAAYSVFVKQYGDWNAGAAWERWLMLGVHARPLPEWARLLVAVTPWLGTNLILFPIIAVAAIWMLRRGRRDLAAWLMVSEIGCLAHNYVLKHMFARERPDLWEKVGWYGWGAYPSGHAMASFAVLGTIALMLLRERGWRWPFLGVAFLGLVNSYGRIYHGVHWPTDVLGGGVVGLIWLLVTAVAFDGLPRRRTRDQPGGFELPETRRAEA